MAATDSRASQTIVASTRIDLPVSIAANQDLILGAIRLRAAATAAPSGVRATTSISAFEPSTGHTRAFFIIAGQANQAVSVALPRQVPLIDRDGTGGVLVDTGPTTAPTTLDREGLLIFGIQGRLFAETKVSAGAYRGLLVATAQYN